MSDNEHNCDRGAKLVGRIALPMDPRKWIEQDATLAVLLNGMIAGWGIYYAAAAAARVVIDATQLTAEEKAQLVQCMSEAAREAAQATPPTAADVRRQLDEIVTPLLVALGVPPAEPENG